MNEPLPVPASTIPLERLLLRNDLWRGLGRHFDARTTLSSGHELLDARLVDRGWPLAALIEICQPALQWEWQLLSPALQQLPGRIVLLNPPAVPFAQALLQNKVDLERLLIVETQERKHFLACFSELSRAGLGAILSWQPPTALSYTELRKCQLAASEGTGLSVLFRPPQARRQSSPAALRLHTQLVASGLEITVFKQKGHLQGQPSSPIVLSLPAQWQTAQPYWTPLPQGTQPLRASRVSTRFIQGGRP